MADLVVLSLYSARIGGDGGVHAGLDADSSPTASAEGLEFDVDAHTDAGG